jgi:hypothetical protein
MAAVGYVRSGDPSKVSRSGDTMTGPLVLPGPPQADLQAADKGYVDGADAGLMPRLNQVQVGELVAAAAGGALTGTGVLASDIHPAAFSRREQDLIRTTVDMDADPALSIDVDGGATYLFDALLLISGALQFSWSGPSGAVVTSVPSGLAVVISGSSAGGDVQTVGARGILRTTDPGTFALMWGSAMAGSDAALLSESGLRLVRVD